MKGFPRHVPYHGRIRRPRLCAASERYGKAHLIQLGFMRPAIRFNRNVSTDHRSVFMAKQIIFVPGKNPKPEPDQHRSMLWRTLHEGVRRVDESAGSQLDFSRFHLIGWNYLFYRQHRDASIDAPWIEALMARDGPTRTEMREAHSWNKRVNRLAMCFGDGFPPLVNLLPKEVTRTAHEIERYFNNTDQLADQIRLMLKERLRPLLQSRDEVLLIGHSLGSVIAYDALWELSQENEAHGQVDLLTLGSPLGMKFIFKRLHGISASESRTYPINIRHWHNVSSEGDLVALNRKLGTRFQEMLKRGFVKSIEDHYRGVYNHFRNDTSLNFHRSYGYLINPVVGRLIAEWQRNPALVAPASQFSNHPAISRHGSVRPGRPGL